MLPVSTATKKWHPFREDDCGDDVCGRCAVTVTLEAHMTFTLQCPFPPCPSEKNPDIGCVMAPNEKRQNLSTCLFCGRAGERVGEESEPFAGLPTAPTD